MYDTYTCLGHVYSPAFSDPPSPMSTSSDSEGRSTPVNMAEKSRGQSAEAIMLSTSPVQPQISSQETQQPKFVNRKPRFPTIYHEALQPLLPVTTLPVPSTAPVNLSGNPKVCAVLQEQFLNLLRISDLSEIESFLKEHSENMDLNHCVNEWGELPLHEACVRGDLSLAKLLIQFGADHRLTNRDGFSPLHLASFSGNPQLINFVINLRSENASK